MAEEKKAEKSRFPVRFTVGWILLLSLLQILRVFAGLDDKWMDTLYRMRGMEQADARVRIVTLDDTSLKKIGQFPWPRSVYEKLFDGLFRNGVKVVGVDVMFFDPSRPAEDQALIRVTKRYGDRIVHAIGVDPGTLNQNNFLYPFPGLKAVAKSVGLVTQPFIDNDGSVRNVPLMVGRSPTAMSDGWAQDAERLPTLGVKVLSIFEGKPVDSYLKSLGNFVALNVRGQQERVAMRSRDANGVESDIMVMEYGIKRIPAWKIIEDKLDAQEREALKGGITLIGSTTLGYYDHFPTAFDGQAPGVETHANLIDNVLNDRYFRTVPLWASLLLIVLLGAIAYQLIHLNLLNSALAFMGLLALWGAASWGAFHALYRVDFYSPLLALTGTFIVLIIHRALMEEKQKREVRAMFGQYVSPEVVDILVKDPTKIRLGGDKRDMTVFFLDIAHFTTISEKMTPEDLIKFLNTYLTDLTDTILRNHGVVDKYIGDCIMAFWNAPLDTPGHRVHACTAAVECLEVIERLNQSYVDPSIPEKPAVRIGLNSGEVVVGNTGSARKLAYTVLGDDVNLASRLEGANKFFGSTVMASESTYEEAKTAVEGRELGRVRVVGKAIPIKVYELLAKKGALKPEWQKALPEYNRGLELYAKRDFAKAKEAFEGVLKVLPGDKPAKLYVSTCSDYLKVPPPADWDGVFNLTSK
ncbi:MAG: adenylate/guanylate cyclase domain-containing protein [Elusimicrobiota bacterium]|jgi:adenylate cyclase